MNIFTVALFRHREIEDLRNVGKRIYEVISQLIRTKPYVSFLVGRNGEFDECAASVIRHAKKALGGENVDLTLILPYSVADIEYYVKYYDDVIIPDSLYMIHPKAAITERNRWMVERADLVLVYVERNAGGAYSAMKYAKKLKKPLMNLYFPSDTW